MSLVDPSRQSSSVTNMLDRVIELSSEPVALLDPESGCIVSASPAFWSIVRDHQSTMANAVRLYGQQALCGGYTDHWLYDGQLRRWKASFTNLTNGSGASTVHIKLSQAAAECERGNAPLMPSSAERLLDALLTYIPEGITIARPPDVNI